MEKIIEFKTLDSTNDYLKREYKTLEDMTLITADIQTAGRGRLNRVWNSQEGNLYCSILLKNNLTFDSLFYELVKTSLSIIRLLDLYEIESSIKYPNDILVKGKKAAGVLIESKGNSSLEYLIIGVGLNVNQIDFGTLQSKATSMKLERGKAYTIKQVLKDFIDIYSKIEPNLEEYVKHSIIIGKTITLNKEVYVVNGITVNGSLILKQNETTIEMKLNEISFEEIYNEFNN